LHPQVQGADDFMIIPWRHCIRDLISKVHTIVCTAHLCVHLFFALSRSSNILRDLN
jgi:hypothetical protein